MIVVALACALGAPTAAVAQGASALADPSPPPSAPASPAPSPVRLELLAGTTAPLDVGVRARLVLFDHLVLGVGFGVGAYGELARSVAASAGAGAGASGIAADLASGLFSFETSVALRPTDAGFELGVGYALLYRQTTLDGAAVADAFGVQGVTVPDVGATMTLHAIHAELAWTIAIGDVFLLRPAIGWLHVLGADVTLAAGGLDARRQAVLDGAASDLATGLRTWGMTPTLSLSAGVRF